MLQCYCIYVFQKLLKYYLASGCLNLISARLLRGWKLSLIFWVCFFFTAQPQLPWRETALWIPAQQAGPHQATNSWFWPAQSPGLVLRAHHGSSSLISIVNGVSNQGGVDQPAPIYLTPLHFLPYFFLPFPIPDILHSLPLFLNSTGSVIACNIENLFFFFLHPRCFGSCGIDTTGSGERSSLLVQQNVWNLQLHLVKDSLQTKSIFEHHRETINLYLSKKKKKEGDVFILRLVLKTS